MSGKQIADRVFTWLSLPFLDIAPARQYGDDLPQATVHQFMLHVLRTNWKVAPESLLR